MGPLPCKSCGHPAPMVLELRRERWWRAGRWAVCCGHAGCVLHRRGVEAETEAEAIEGWNFLMEDPAARQARRRGETVEGAEDAAFE